MEPAHSPDREPSCGSREGCPASEPSAPRRTLRRASRLTGRNAFGPVFAARLRRQAGPLDVRVAPNGLGFHRLGVSTPKKIGNAVVRHRWKRRVREAFRQHRHGWAGAYDVVVVVRPSRKTFSTGDVARLLEDALARLHGRASRLPETATGTMAAPGTPAPDRSPG